MHRMTQTTENTCSQVPFHDERWGPTRTHNLILLEQFWAFDLKDFPHFCVLSFLVYSAKVGGAR